MQKKNIFQKKFNKLVISITKRIESFFDFFKVNFFTKKKKYSIDFKTTDKRIFLALAIILIIGISYFVLPSFYDENKIKAQIENQILEEYNLKAKLNKSLSYGLFPKPHFSSKNMTIEYKSDYVAQSNDLKIFISIDNLFSVDKLRIKNLIFKKTDFKIKSSNFQFFIDLLSINKNDQNINFLNSKFSYLNQNDDIIFTTSLKKLNYFFQENLLQKLYSKFDLFNLPINLYTKHNIVEKKFFTEIKSHPLRLNIKNDLNYNDKEVNGEIDLTIINENRKINYTLKNNNLVFSTKDNKFTGNTNIIPFYLSTYLKLYQVDLKKIFKNNSILVNILKSEFLNNENLNGKVNININNFKGVNFLDETNLDVFFENGEILIQNLKTTFKNSLIINLSDTQLIIEDNNLKFAGYLDLDFVDINNFYRHYQINKNDRKKIKKINFVVLFNLDEQFITIDNLKVDGILNKRVNKFLNDFNFNKENIFNKVMRRNLVKDFFKNL